jgi:hypothetical protein
MFEVDHKAKERANKFGLPLDVHILIGARDKNAINMEIMQAKIT